MKISKFNLIIFIDIFLKNPPSPNMFSAFALVKGKFVKQKYSNKIVLHEVQTADFDY